MCNQITSKLVISLIGLFIYTSSVFAATSPDNKDNVEEAFSVFTNMDTKTSYNFFSDMGITTEVIGKEIYFIYNETPAFILNKKTEYLIVPDPNGGFTIESEKSYVMGNISNKNILEFSHLNKKNLKIKRYRKK